ncbi:thiamine phosphate synthase [Shewanella sp.]|jgi:hydroxymethylpyrimidine kinase/phosphomethylpyrimidine kinase/thiamine-phosphate diphosphorylase|uniref:thiamine phosphate synthase n=2 Tax=Shewanella sp. TaxID=50422 RepID=UPI0040479F79
MMGRLQCIKTLERQPIVWTIAGSDSGGGAGIQADLLTMKDLDCHGCSVITSITAQNSVAVKLVEPVSEHMLISQLDALWSDLPPRAIKIGLLVSQQQVNCVAKWLTHLAQQDLLPFVVLDPVMVASSGHGFGQCSIDFKPMAGLMSLLTPNQHELSHLCANLLLSRQQDTSPVNDEHTMASAATWLANEYQCHVVAKGGDARWQQQDAIDMYVTQKVANASDIHNHRVFKLSSPRVNTQDNHGSGCTFSAAIACFIAHQFVLHDAIVMAKAYVNNGLTNSYQVGQGPGVLARTGWPDTLAFMPTITPVGTVYPSHCQTRFKPILSPLGVYPVLDSLSQLIAVLNAGCKTLQFRVKVDPPLSPLQTQALEQSIIDAIAIGRDFNAQLFINDHWQLAIKHGAFGVHLGQEDLSCADLNAIANAGLALGISSHGCFEALLAHQYSPSYIALGHIYPTSTKQMPSAPQGLIKLAHYVTLLGEHYPTVAIGGIDSDRLEPVASTGVADVAVVRAITEASDPALSYRLLHQRWLQLTRKRAMAQCLPFSSESLCSA